MPAGALGGTLPFVSVIGPLDALSERLGTPADPVLESPREDALHALRLELSDDEIEDGLALRRRLSRDEAIVLALALEEP